MNKKYIHLFVTIVASIVILSKYYRADKKIKAKHIPSVSCMAVFESDISTTLESIGTAISNESVDIASTITQRVESINFNDCDFVKKDQVLVQLNTDKKNAEKKQAEINLKEQERELNRLVSLKKKKIIPEKDFDTQQTKFLNAKAQLDVINADLKESVIIAPFDGIVGLRKVSVGTLLTTGTVVATLDDIKKIKVDFPIPEKYSLLIKPELQFKATSIAVPKNKFYGNVLAVDPRISSVSRSINVRGIIENENLALRPGMMIRISIRLQDRKAIQIPEKSLQSIGERHYVFLISEDNVVSKRYVSIGERSNGLVEVTRGLHVGEKIVADGSSKLSDGDTVIIQNDETNVIASSKVKTSKGMSK